MFVYQTKLKDGTEALILKNNPVTPATDEQVVAVYDGVDGEITASVSLLKDGEITPSND